MKFLQELVEAKAFRTPSALQKMTPEMIADDIFIHLLIIQAMKFDSASDAQAYAKRTFQYQSWTALRGSATDLHNWLVVMINPEDYEEAIGPMGNRYIDVQMLKRYMRDTAKGKIDVNFDRRFLLSAEKSLKISNSNYRAMRRLSSEWGALHDNDRRLVITRLLQALRVKIPQSDLKASLEQFSKHGNWEIKDAKNAEKGTSGAALAGAAVIGGVAGYQIGKSLAHKMTGANKTGNW